MVSSPLFCTHCGAANQAQAAFCYACGQAIRVPGNLQTGHSGPLGVSEVLKGRYRIAQQVGTGGFGAVYKAEDVDLGNRLVAVKEMSQHNLSPQEIVEAAQSFKQEALLLADLMNEHLPRIYDHFSECGRWYLVMDYIRGETLDEYLQQKPGGCLPLDEALDIALQLCSVLDYLHTRQSPIIFRDLKPSNVILTPDHQVFLIDFGIARHFKPGQAKDTIAFGSPGYAPPEQYGKAQTTPRADIYSLGAILHQMLSGDDPSLSPFRFAPLKIQAPALQQLLTCMLDLDESKRPASMAEVKRELQRSKDQPQAILSQIGSLLKSAFLARVTRPTTGSGLLIYEGHASPVHSIAWSYNSAYIASASNEIVRVWDVQTGREFCTYQEHLSQLLDMDWAPNTMHIASLSRDSELRVWNANTGQTVDNYAVTSGDRLLAWSPDARFLALAGSGTMVKVMDVPKGRQAFLLQGHFQRGYTALSWSPGGDRLAASSETTVIIWNIGTQKAALTYEHSTQVNAVAWSPDGKCIASGGYGKLIQIWRTSDKGLVYLCSSDRLEHVSTLIWSPNGHMIASGGLMGTLQIWDARTGNSISTYSGHTNGILSVAWSPNGRYLASSGSDATVRVWRAPGMFL